MRFLGTDNDRSIETNLSSYRPKYYEQSKDVVEITRVDAIELENFYNAAHDTFAQFFIDTATWTLSKWEAMLGIKIDETKPVDQRRSVVKSKLRQFGTSTVAMVKNVAESYFNGEVELTEESGTYNIKVKFVGKRGQPPNLDDIKNAIREVTPAHLGLTFEFVYVTYGELEGANYTFNFLDTKTWDQLESTYV